MYSAVLLSRLSYPATTESEDAALSSTALYVITSFLFPSAAASHGYTFPSSVYAYCGFDTEKVNPLSPVEREYIPLSIVLPSSLTETEDFLRVSPSCRVSFISKFLFAAEIRYAGTSVLMVYVTSSPFVTLFLSAVFSMSTSLFLALITTSSMM